MSQSSAPWLAGLDGTSTWTTKPSTQITTRPTSVTHDASSLIQRVHRTQQRSRSGNPITTLRKARSPLAPLSANENGSTKRFPQDSDLDALEGTVQLRAKSSSPEKRQGTLEWRKRLLQGKIAYGDQTDLFGPSGLENIFDSGNRKKAAADPSQRSDIFMPSSPPAWPLRKQATVEQEKANSFKSPAEHDAHARPESICININAKPDDEAPASRTLLAVTELEQEDFSPVFVSKHTTLGGRVDYAAIDRNVLKECRHHKLVEPANPKAEEPASVEVIADHTPFTDGPDSDQAVQAVQDLSLSENLPTGTPEPLGRFVQVQRGGYSVVGSFKHRPLSAEPFSTSPASIMPSNVEMVPAPTPPLTAAGSSTTLGQARRDAPSTPLKLFAAHDTFTSRHLLHRMSEINDDALDPLSDVENSTNKNEARLVDSSRHSNSSPASDVAVSGSHAPQGFHTNAADNTQRLQSLGKRLRDSQSTTAQVPASPLKASTPKRRRTLHASELLTDLRPVTLEGSRVMLEQGSKVADEIHQLDDSVREATEDFLLHEDRSVVASVIEAVEESLTETDPVTIKQRAEAVAEEVAKFTIRSSKIAEAGGIRKPSVTTQDFFREAECVMEYIRARAAQKKSTLASVAEHSQHESNGMDQSLRLPKGTTRQEPHMRISREPSWEDRPRSGWREPEQQRLQRSAVDGNRVASQLRRWQEPDANDEQDEFLADCDAESASSELVYDQQAQIRITGPSSEYNRQQDGIDSRPTSQRSAQSSTRKSDNVGTLAPSAVAHLIGSEVGGMTFDKDKQRWMRTRSPERNNDLINVHASHLTSEDDPFREISDLAVDESTEKRRISSPARMTVRLKEQLEVPWVASDTRPASLHLPQRQVSFDNTVLHPKEHGEDVSPEVSLTIDERVTNVLDEAEAAITIEKRYVQDSFGTTASAPEADYMQRTELNKPARPGILKAVTYDEASAPVLPRPAAMYSLVEQSEVSFMAPISGDRVVSVSLSVSKPVTTQQLGHVLESSPLRNMSTMVLSDLPDFTVNDCDDIRPSEIAMAKRFARYAADEANDRFATVTKELMRVLTDTYPQELYWDELRNLSLQQRSLTTLHGLDRYCQKVYSMDVSGNALAQLDGVPSTLQHLTARNNKLSSLTQFAHLRDLQYVDLTRNELDDLSALAHCIHLRELNINDNAVADLSELAALDILKLRCRRNKINNLLLAEGQYRMLGSLDLSTNGLTSIRGLGSLTQLETLILANNDLSTGFELGTQLDNLKYLDVRNCKLTQLSVSMMPRLETLIADDNCLNDIEGLSDLEHLQVISMQRQTLAPGAQVEILSRSIEAHTIRLNGNVLQKLTLGSHCLSVKHLELAAVGLTELPVDFGLLMPNLRSLNLNFNSLKDMRPLLHLNALRTLQLAGNRISRLRKSAAVLSHLSSLSSLDLRDNPMTQGLYSTAIAPQCDIIVTLERSMSSEDEDERIIKADQRRYEPAAQDGSTDLEHALRLDDATALRRRVYHLLLAHSCKPLQMLDSLSFDKSQVMAKDRIWEQLLSLGVLRRSTEKST